MFKILLIIPCVCIFSIVNSQALQKDEKILYWTKNHRLTFADFQGSPAKEDTTMGENPTKPLTHKLGSIIKGIDVLLKTEQGKTMFTIRAGMKKNSSWIKNPGDTISLNHEQGHFDICEIYARLLRRDIKNAKSLSEAREMFDKITNEEETEQENYDKANTYQSGGITPGWKDRIFNRLKALNAYEKPEVFVPIDK